LQWLDVTSFVTKPLLSACLIVKNEAHCLAQCLDSIVRLVDEIIIVDTGSSDKTVAIARQYTDQILHFAWCDDFSAARNQALQAAQGDWILSIDADESLDPDTAAALPAFIAQQNAQIPQVFNFLVITPQQQPLLTRALFPRLADLCFKGRVHEGLRFQECMVPQHACPQFILHHRAISSESQRDKASYYLALIQAELASTLSAQEQADYCFHAAESYLLLGDDAQALRYYRLCIKAFAEAGLSEYDPFYINVLGRCLPLMLSQQQALPLATRYAQTLVRLQPSQRRNWRYLAWLQFWQGNHQAAAYALQQACQRSAEEISTYLEAWLEIRLLAAAGNLAAAIARLEPLYFETQELELLLFRIFLALQQHDQASIQRWVQAWRPELKTLPAILSTLRQQDIWCPAERKRLRC